MNRDAIIDALLARIDQGAEPKDLMRSAIEASNPALAEAALDTFGSWLTVLAEAAIAARVLPEPGQSTKKEPSLVDEERPEREVGAGANRPLLIHTPRGAVLTLALDRFPATRRPVLRDFPRGPDSSYSVQALGLSGFDTGVTLFTSTGRAVIVDQRVLDAWEPGTFPRALSNRFPELEPGEGFVQVVPTASMRNQDRFYSVSRDGQFKASDCKEYTKLSREPIAAFLLKDGDQVFRCLAGPRKSSIFVASSAGKALVFAAGDVRSQGRKATGVRSMSLDPGAKIVGAFIVPPRGVRHLALATKSGLIKRTPLSEYRPQGRGGGGLQSTRLGGGDGVVSCVAVDLSADIVVLTNRGRVARFPVYDLPFQARHGRGDSLLDLHDGEEIAQLLRVPAGEFED